MENAYYNDNIGDYFDEIKRQLWIEDGRKIKSKTQIKKEVKEVIVTSNIDDLLKEYARPKTLNPKSREDENLKSKIFYSGNYKNRERDILKIKSYDNSFEKREYHENFNEFPLNTLIIQSKTEIYHDFYEYRILGRTNWDFSDIKHIFNFEIPDQVARHRSVFLFENLVEKFDNLTNLYPKCLKKSRLYYKLDKKTPEEIVLKNTIQFYANIVKSSNEQLNIFRAVSFTKKVSDLFTKILIEFLTLRLNTISTDFDKFYITEQEGQDQYKKEYDKIVYQLPENFKLNEEKAKAFNLNIKQTAILFFYWRKHGATITYSDQSFSELVHYLTGHSRNNLRQRSGFGSIVNIEKETRQEQRYYNVKRVIELLETIIKDLKKQIKD